jgi:hypothetical protein
MKRLYNQPELFKLFAAVILIWITTTTAQAQLYPVQATSQLVPPYSVYLSDYATPGNEKLRVILVQRDLTQPAYQLRLVMSVELNGKVILRTARTYNPPPISLSPGIPTVISGADLSPYLDSRNIDFVGYSREQYERTRALPEGSYQITFTAYDYRRQDVQVSNAGSNFYYLSKNEPPLINFPACGTQVPMRTPQQIIFSWLPRNTASPNSAAETQYEFALYETRPLGRNPNDVVLSTQPVFRTLIDYTQLVYGPAEPLLLEGMKYVWRVRAIDREGRDAFRNNGYSEICTFTYGGVDPNFDIGIVKGIQAEGETERRAKIGWTKGNFDAYRVNYKKTGNGYEWFTSDVTSEQLTRDGKTDGELKLFDLEPDTEYETRIQGKKSGIYGGYSEIKKFRTQPMRIAKCGDQTPLPNSAPKNPFRSGIKGTIVNADGMEVMFTEVTHLGEGFYKGTGRVSIAYLGGAVFNVKFDRIFVDEDRNVGQGRIDFITKGVAAMVEEQLAGQQKRQDEKKQQENRDQWAGTDFYEKVFAYDQMDIETITPGGASVVNITDDKGNVSANAEVMQVINSVPDKAVIIQDKNGDQWVVQKDKTTGEVKVTKVEGGGLMPGDSTPIAGEDKDVIKKALRELRKEYNDRIKNISLVGSKIEYTTSLVILLFSDETNNAVGYQLIASGVTIDEKKLTVYLSEAGSQNKTEADQVNAVKSAIVDAISNITFKMMSDLDGYEQQITQVLGSSSVLVDMPRTGPKISDLYAAIPAGMPEDEIKLSIIRNYIQKIRNDEDKLKDFLTKGFGSILTDITSIDNEKLSDYVVQCAKLDYGEIWWRAPYWERAAKILQEHFEDQDIYEDVFLSYGTGECRVTGIINLSEDGNATATMEVTFSNRQTPAELWDILHDTYGVDFLVARDVTLETFSEWWWNYMAIKDDNLHHQKGWESASLLFFADMLMAAPGTIEGWVTGKHWRTGEELALWEHALGILDVIPAEAFAKAGITAFVIKIGGKLIDFTKLTQPVKNLILSAKNVGLKLLVKSKDEIVIFASNGTQQVGRLLNGVLQDLYWVYGGEKILARLAGVKYMVDPATKKIVDGTLEIVEESGSVGVRAVTVVVKLSDEIDKVLITLKAKAKYVLEGTGEYGKVGGHHPVAKVAFEGDLVYDYKKAFSVPGSELDKVSGIDKVHTFITGQQNSLYTAWRKANPNAKLTIDVMAEIEIKAMKNVGVPEDIAIGWVIKALEDLKAQGVTAITNIPWNGIN